MENISQALVRLGVMDITTTVGHSLTDQSLVSYSAIDGTQLGTVGMVSPGAIGPMVERSQVAFDAWRRVPAPVRGDVVRAIGNALREHKEDLAAIVSLEVGKITQEALGEVQEMIDICDYAVGLSRGLTGLTIASERPNHRLSELWHPLGVVGVISAFNFPVAVWAWNAMLAFVCGDPVIWKPSEKAPLCASAVQSILRRVFAEYSCVPENLHQIAQGGADVGVALAAHRGVALVSATGSVPMGRSVAEVVGSRLGKVLLELGGNNAAIVAPSADLELAIRGIVFGAVDDAAASVCACKQVCRCHRPPKVSVCAFADRKPDGEWDAGWSANRCACCGQHGGCARCCTGAGRCRTFWRALDEWCPEWRCVCASSIGGDLRGCPYLQSRDICPDSVCFIV